MRFSDLEVEHLAQSGENQSETEHSKSSEEPAVDRLSQVSASYRDDRSTGSTSFRDGQGGYRGGGVWYRGVRAGRTLVLVGVGVAVSGNAQDSIVNSRSVNPCCSQYNTMVCVPSEVWVSRLTPTGATKPPACITPSILQDNTVNGPALLLTTAHCISVPGMDTQ